MNVITNHLAVFAAILGSLSGSLLALGILEEALAFFGTIYALFLTPVIGYILYRRYAVSLKSGLLLVLWLIVGTVSWYSAFFVVMLTTGQLGSMTFAVALASILGFSIVWLYVCFLEKTFDFFVYLKKALGVSLAAALCVWLAFATGGEFDGFLDGVGIDVIHIVWQALVSYFMVSHLTTDTFNIANR